MQRYCVACQSVYDDARRYILCPHELRQAPRCRFCSEAPVELRCYWSVEGFQSVKYEDLKPGDVVKRGTSSQQIVNRIEVVGGGYLGFTFVGDLEREIVVRCWSPVQALRKRACGTAVCELHLRQVAENVVYCVDHWRAWEAV